ncbi:MAG: hypothetical protein V4594_17785 [Bacteroidota bacterium]
MLHFLIPPLLVLVLALMGIQDFKYRAISWYAFPLLALFLLLRNAAFNWMEFGINIGFIVFNYLLLTVFFSIRSQKKVNLLDGFIGLGDMLMLVCLAFYFPTLLFFSFYLFSLLVIALGSGLYLLSNQSKPYTVPLAGLQSLILLCLLLLSWYKGTELNEFQGLDRFLL